MKKTIYLIIIIISIAVGIFSYKKYFKPSADNPTDTDTALATSTIDLTLTETYINERYNFSFKHPTSLEITFTEGVEEPKDILLMEASDPKQSIQIDIQPIDEDIKALIVERIRQDLPDILIENPQDVILGENGKGVAFISEDPSFEGKTREVWFVYDMTLYQIRTYALNDPLMKSILNSWSFGGSNDNE